MICYWLNDALCLSPEDQKERDSLVTIYNSFRAGLKPHPDEEKPKYSWSGLNADRVPESISVKFRS